MLTPCQVILSKLTKSPSHKNPIHERFRLRWLTSSNRGVWEEDWNKTGSDYFVPSAESAGPEWIVRRLMNERETQRVRLKEVNAASVWKKPWLSLSVVLPVSVAPSGTGSRIVCDQHVWAEAQHALLSWGRSGRKWPGVGCALWVMSKNQRGGASHMLPLHLHTHCNRTFTKSLTAQRQCGESGLWKTQIMIGYFHSVQSVLLIEV